MANSHTKAVNKYNAANYDSLRIVVPKGQKEKIKAHAEKRGESINGFVGRAINETLQRDEKAEKIIQLDVTNKPLIPPNITRFKRVSVPGNILSLLEQNVL